MNYSDLNSAQHFRNTISYVFLLFVFLTFSREAPGPIKQNNVQYSDAIFCDYGEVIIKATIQL